MKITFWMKTKKKKLNWKLERGISRGKFNWLKRMRIFYHKLNHVTLFPRCDVIFHDVTDLSWWISQTTKQEVKYHSLKKIYNIRNIKLKTRFCDDGDLKRGEMYIRVTCCYDDTTLFLYILCGCIGYFFCI